MRNMIPITVVAGVLLSSIGCSSLPTKGSLARKKKDSAGQDVSAAQAKSGAKRSGASAIATGLRYERAGNDRLACQAYLEAVQKSPGSVVAHHRLAAVCDRLGKFEEAETHYKKALELSPDNPDIYNDLGYSYHLSARHTEAEKALRQCLALNPNHARAHNNMGLVLGRLGRQQESIAEFRRGGGTDTQAASSFAFARPKLKGISNLMQASHEEPAPDEPASPLWLEMPGGKSADSQAEITIEPPAEAPAELPTDTPKETPEEPNTKLPANEPILMVDPS